jgi:hypothetical protein
MSTFKTKTINVVLTVPKAYEIQAGMAELEGMLK